MDRTANDLLQQIAALLGANVQPIFDRTQNDLLYAILQALQANGGTGGGGGAIPNTVLIHAVVGGGASITGTASPVSGIADGSENIQCAAFANVRVEVFRGLIPLPSIEPGDNGAYFTKPLASDTVALSTPLANGEFLILKTISK